MDTSPPFDLTDTPEKIPDLISQTTEEDDQEDESSHLPESPTWGPADTPPPEDIKTPESLTPNGSSVEEAMTRYYKLKGDYDKKYNRIAANSKRRN